MAIKVRMLTVVEKPYAALNGDLDLLCGSLEDSIRMHTGEYILNIIKDIRNLSKKAIQHDEIARIDLLDLLKQIDPNLLLPITKYFSQTLNFSNIAEEYNALRVDRLSLVNEDTNFVERCDLNKLFMRAKQDEMTSKAVYNAILSINVDFVLTAHPTELKRRSIIRKYKNLHKILQELDQKKLTEDERLTSLEKLKQEISSIWLTPEVRREKPTPIDEANWGVATVHDSIWHAVPLFMKTLDRLVAKYLGKELPIDFMPIKFSSWMGGDRDGNPNVDSITTIRVSILYRQVALDLLIQQLTKVADSLTIAQSNQQIRTLAGDAEMPYKHVLMGLIKQLKNSFALVEKITQDQDQEIDLLSIYADSLDIAAVLKNCYNSLLQIGAKVLARGEILDLIRQFNCFGLHLMPIDLRQNAKIHANTMQYLVTKIGLVDYATLSEQEKQQLLYKLIRDPKQALLAPEIINNDPTNVLQTLNVLNRLPANSCNNYIIAMCQNVSEILLVLYFQVAVGLNQLIPIVPLFETGNALINSSQILEQLFSSAVYRKLINNYQQVMIGYSDSAKDIGILAANWLLFETQGKLLSIATEHKIDLVFFHGRGGSISRGGWPVQLAVQSQPGNALHGRMRVTVQGEVIKNKFGITEIAIKTMTNYVASCLEAIIYPMPKIEKSWVDLMQVLCEVSKAEYQQTLNKDYFIEYFDKCTPIHELDLLAVASRPSRRDAGSKLQSFDNLRAIPWIFSWTQNRLMLTSWLGVGQALAYILDNNKQEIFYDMYNSWPFFRSMIYVLQVAIAYSNPDISLFYENFLTNDKHLQQFGADLREKHKFCVTQLEEILQKNKLLTNDVTLFLNNIKTRENSLLPLHILQAQLIKGIRNGYYGQASVGDIHSALLITITGISAGMRNTG